MPPCAYYVTLCILCHVLPHVRGWARVHALVPLSKLTLVAFQLSSISAFSASSPKTCHAANLSWLKGGILLGLFK
jgi:hypothetical protein